MTNEQLEASRKMVYRMCNVRPCDEHGVVHDDAREMMQMLGIDVATQARRLDNDKDALIQSLPDTLA